MKSQNTPLLKNPLPANVWRLAFAQPLVMSIASLNVFVGGIVGARLAPSPELSTIPVAALAVGTALCAVPVSMLMKYLGRRLAFQVLLLGSMLLAFFAAYAIIIGSFYFFCISSLLFGTTTACVLQFRFAAIESVGRKDAARATGAVMIGGIFAAFIGPELGTLGKELLKTEYVGSYLLLSLCFLLALVILFPFKNPMAKKKEKAMSPPRPLRVIAKQPVLWVAVLNAAVGYAVMSGIMTATPVSMHVMEGHSLEHTKWVIQSHILAMYLPSLTVGYTVKKLGLGRMMLLGTLLYGVCILVGLSGYDLGHYWFTLIFLGVGWNCMFLGGTTLLPYSYEPHERFKVQGLNEAVVFGTQAFASMSAGWIVFTLGWRMLLIFTIPVLLLQALITLRWMRTSGFSLSRT